MTKLRPFACRRKPEAPENARERLLDAGLKLFAEKGLDGVSVREIAKAANLNVSLVSYYFGGKEGLYEALLEGHAQRLRREWAEFYTQFQQREPSKDKFVQAIRWLVTGMVEMRASQPEISILMQRERLNGLLYARRTHEELMSTVAEQILGLLGEAQKRGWVRPDVNLAGYFICLSESVFGSFSVADAKMRLAKDTYRLPKEKNAFIDLVVGIFTQGVLV